MGVAVTLRDAQLGDREQLQRLLAVYLFEFDGRRTRIPYPTRTGKSPSGCSFLIEVDGEVVGLCLIRRRDDGWSIAEFSVLADRRRGGVGRAAVDALVARARSDSAAYLEAKVHRDNRGALPFWLAVGFSEIEGPGTGVTVTRRAYVEPDPSRSTYA